MKPKKPAFINGSCESVNLSAKIIAMKPLLCWEEVNEIKMPALVCDSFKWVKEDLCLWLTDNIVLMHVIDQVKWKQQNVCMKNNEIYCVRISCIFICYWGLLRSNLICIWLLRGRTEVNDTLMQCLPWRRFCQAASLSEPEGPVNNGHIYRRSQLRCNCSVFVMVCCKHNDILYFIKGLS